MWTESLPPAPCPLSKENDHDCVSPQGTLEDQVDQRFGRCVYFLVIDSDTMNFEVIENPNQNLGGGAGIQSAQLMAQHDVKAVLTGNVGPNAWQALSAAGIQVFAGAAGGTVRNAVENWKNGKLTALEQANVESHFGMGGGGEEWEEEEAEEHGRRSQSMEEEAENGRQ